MTREGFRPPRDGVRRQQFDPGGGQPLRNLGAGRVDQCRLRRRRRRARRHGEIELGRIGHTDLGAGGVVDRGVQRQRPARPHQAQRYRQQDVVFIAGRLKTLKRVAGRRRPGDLGPGEVIGPGPVDARLDPGIARRAPISVPAGRQPDFEPGLDRRTRPGGLGRGDQPGRRVGVADPAGRRRISAARPAKRQRGENRGGPPKPAAVAPVHAAAAARSPAAPPGATPAAMARKVGLVTSTSCESPRYAELRRHHEHLRRRGAGVPAGRDRLGPPPGIPGRAERGLCRAMPIWKGRRVRKG